MAEVFTLDSKRSIPERARTLKQRVDASRRVTYIREEDKMNAEQAERHQLIVNVEHALMTAIGKAYCYLGPSEAKSRIDKLHASIALHHGIAIVKSGDGHD